MGIAFSVNGKLVSSYGVAASIAEERGGPYVQIEIGRPIVVRYLRFRITYPRFEEWVRQQLMISTYMKTSEKKTAEAEAVTFFDADTRFKGGIFELEDFGAHRYGHPLLYYSKAYAGEAMRLTTRVMELNSTEVIKAVSHVLESAAGLPVFTSFLPYAAIAKAGIGIVSKILQWLITDTTIVAPEPLDLEFKVPNARRLQSGRYVIAIGISDQDLIAAYQLTHENRLVHSGNGHEYTRGSYWILQVNSSEEKRYEKFEYFAQAAELLAKTNRPKSLMEMAQDVANMAESAADIGLVRKIEDLRFDEKTDDTKGRINAYFKLMSPDMKQLYEKRVKELLGEQ